MSDQAGRRWLVKMGPYRLVIDAADLLAADRELDRRLERLELVRAPGATFDELDDPEGVAAA